MRRWAGWLLWLLSAALVLFTLLIVGSSQFKEVLGSHSQWVIQKNGGYYTGFYLTYWPGSYTFLNFGGIFHRSYIPPEIMFAIAWGIAAAALLLRYFDKESFQHRTRLIIRAAKSVAITCCIICVLVMLGDGEDSWRIAIVVWLMGSAFWMLCEILVRKNPPEDRRAVRQAYKIVIVNLLLIGMTALMQPSV